jgi:hypothetical protein
MKVHIPIAEGDTVKACYDCQSYFYNWKMSLTGKKPVCLKTAPKVPQDLVLGIPEKVELELIKACQEERTGSGGCGEIGRRWEKKPDEYCDNGW